MPAISGISGLVALDSGAVHNAREWSINITASEASYAGSATDGATGEKPGITDWTGSFSAWGATPAANPGDTFTFHGSFDGVNGGAGDAIATEFTISWNQEQGTVISHVVQFGADGAWTPGAEAGVADSTVPNPQHSQGCIATITTIGGSPATTEITDIQSMTLTVRRNPNTYNSSTSGGVTRRVTGVLSASGSINCLTDDLTDLPDVNDIVQLKMYVDATTFWDLKWVKITGIQPRVNIETGAVVGATINFMHTGFANVGSGAGTPTKGYIKNPATTAVWP